MRYILVCCVYNGKLCPMHSQLKCQCAVSFLLFVGIFSDWKWKTKKKNCDKWKVHIMLQEGNLSILKMEFYNLKKKNDFPTKRLFHFGWQHHLWIKRWNFDLNEALFIFFSLAVSLSYSLLNKTFDIPFLISRKRAMCSIRHSFPRDLKQVLHVQNS